MTLFSTFWFSIMEGRVGFEPTDRFQSPVFKTGAIDHSTTYPFVNTILIWCRLAKIDKNKPSSVAKASSLTGDFSSILTYHIEIHSAGIEPANNACSELSYVHYISVRYALNVLQYGRGNWIRTSDLDFKDRCLRPLGDTPTYVLL